LILKACRNDLRVLDVALAMLAWGDFGERYDHAAMLRFGQGFAQIATLSDAEITAIPAMMRLVHVVRVLLALGRFQQGFERSVVVERAAMSLLALMRGSKAIAIPCCAMCNVGGYEKQSVSPSSPSWVPACLALAYPGCH
jgi:Ser/Thr protein kinase RdoA (MazF antagonist)